MALTQKSLQTMTKCAICGDEIEGKGKKLADGGVVCLDCYESSAAVVLCETCGHAVLAQNAVRENGGVYCLSCYRKWIEEMIEENIPSWENWVEVQMEELKDPKFEQWAARIEEDMESLTQDSARIGKRIASETLEAMVAGIKAKGASCPEFTREGVRKNLLGGDFIDWETWVDWFKETGGEPSFNEWEERLLEVLADIEADEALKNSKSWKKIATEIIESEIAKTAKKLGRRAA
jgi:hypothetical protein